MRSPALSDFAAKARPHMRLLLAVLLLALNNQSAAALSVDMPHGACRLTVQENSGGTITYGAMPRWVAFPAGTFSVQEIRSVLSARSHDQAQVPIRPESGSVSLSGSSELRSIHDAQLVRRLLEEGWKARLPPAIGTAEEEDYRWLASACSFT
jgi:hypothetical protein